MNHLDLSGRVAVVTGGARGIGYAIAARALQSGAAVTLWDVDRARLEAKSCECFRIMREELSHFLTD